MLLVHWIGLIISNQPHSYGSEWPTGVIKCVQCDFFFFTQTHSIIQIRRIVISGICYDFVVCSLVVWFILVKIQVLWIFFCTFWLLVDYYFCDSFLFCVIVGFYLGFIIPTSSVHAVPLDHVMSFLFLYLVFVLHSYLFCSPALLSGFHAFLTYFIFIFIFHWLFCIFLWTFYCHIN